MEEDLTVDMDFADFIAQQRTNLGMTQAAAAARGGVDPTVWSRVEQHRSTQMTWKMGLSMLKGVGLRVRVVADRDQES